MSVKESGNKYSKQNIHENNNLSINNEEKFQLTSNLQEQSNSLTPNKNLPAQIKESDSYSTLSNLLKLEFDFPKEHGKLGLKNLGNTCYMNSALQVLAHTKELVLYFAKDQYLRDLENKEQDYEGTLRLEFVKNFANLIKEEWSNSKKDVINPLELRSSLVKLYPYFSENIQHDAHEVLTCILDSLHQFLNRRDNKLDLISNPNIALTKQLSQKCWESHLEMNDSVITDLFFGQLKSTIKCLSCKFENFAYDPFSSLGLPIPNEYKILIYFVPLKKNTKPVKFFLKINDNMQFKNLIEPIQNIIEINFNSAMFYFVLNNKFIKLIDLDERCGDLMNRPAFLFLMEEQEKLLEINNNRNSNLEDNFYICLNFLMGETPLDCNILKPASFPRLFSYYYSQLKNEAYNIDQGIPSEDVEIDDKKIIQKLFENLLGYAKQFIQGGEDMKELQNNKLLNISVKSVPKISLNDLSKNSETTYVCVFCDKENDESFVCSCIENLIFLTENAFSFENLNDINYSTLFYYIKNRKDHTDFILDVNVNISKAIIKYKELNRCKDMTNKYTVDTRLTLNDLLNYFTAEEKLTLQDNYHCNQCGKNVIAVKKMEINKLPHILAIHLKRFRLESLGNFGRARVSRRNELGSINQTNFNGEKNETHVRFDVNDLDLTPFCKNNSNTKISYELFAICNHSGTMHSGHYTALCKHPKTLKWVEFDDKIIRNDKGPETIESSNAYMLFYRKKEFNIKI